MMLMQKRKNVGSKGNPFKNKSGCGGAERRKAQRLPPQGVPRKKHTNTSGDGQITDDAYEKQKNAGSKGDR